MITHNLQTLKGICIGILADGELNQEEAEYLLTYLATAPRSFLEKYPANILVARLVSSLEDGVLDDDEVCDLLQILLDIINGIELPPPSYSPLKTGDAPSLYDECDIVFEGNTFVVTGTFESAGRGEIENFIKSKGGIVSKKTVTKKTNYVVIGGIVSEGWVAGNYGRKIESALLLREQGHGLNLVSEQHWLGLFK